jgi:transposase-like protein
LATPLPLSEFVCQILRSLLTRNVTAKPADMPASPWLVGEYGPVDGEAQGLCLLDLQLAVFASTALQLIPTRSALEMIEAGDLTADVLDGVREILNILGQVVQRHGQPRLVLQGVHSLSDASAAARALLAGTAPRTSLELEIGGYGTGCLALVTAPTATQPAPAVAKAGTPAARTAPTPAPHGDVVPNWGATQKVSLILEVLKGTITMDDACRRHGITAGTYRGWAEVFLHGGTTALEPSSGDKRTQLIQQARALQGQISSLLAEIERL